jgi:predicted DsbA family dithiol-disulfide isomerase
VEVERLREKYDIEVRFAPFFLDPSTPPEGKPRRQMTQPGDPPSALEQRGAELGIRFTRGRTWSSNSYLALQAGEWAAEQPDGDRFHRAMLKAYFEDLADIGTIDGIVPIAEAVGLDGNELRAALESGAFKKQTDDGLTWSRAIGVTAVPTFIFDDRYGVVGAQPYEVLEEMMREMGKVPRA